MVYMNNNQINNNQNIITQTNTITEYQNAPMTQQQPQVVAQPQPVNNMPAPPPKKKGKKLIIVLILIVILAGIGYIVYSTMNQSTEKQSKSKASSDSKKVLTWKIEKIEDDCKEGTITIYEDENYEYSVPNSCVANYKIVYSNKEEFTLGEVLNQKKLSVDALNKQGINIIKKSKKPEWEIDKGKEETCTQEVIKIYETEDAEYNANNGCIPNYKVVFTNGEVYTVTKALELNKITVEDLIKDGLNITKSYKNITWTIEKNEMENCPLHIFKVYEDSTFEYNVENNCIANYKVVFSNDEKYNLSDALKKKKVTPEDLQNWGITIYRKPRLIQYAIEKDEDDCKAKKTIIYEDASYEYVVTDSCISNYKLVYTNGDKYSLNEALTNHKVSINELITKGIKIYMVSK